LGDTYGGNVQSGDKVFGNQEFNINRPSRSATKTGSKKVGYDKCLLQVPSRFAIEMINRGWILRNEIIWYKPNCMPSSAKDRFTVDFEKIFFFTKSKKYWFETQYEPHQWLEIEKKRKNFDKPVSYKSKYPKGVGATQRFVKTPRSERYNDNGRNKRCVWKIPPKPFSEAHFAVYPEKLCETPIKAGCPKGGAVLDPFFGSGTTGLVAQKLKRNYIGIELNKDYIKIAEKRLSQKVLI
jgi:site-specific DNA-methyltransferase (adenine-specific)